MFVCPVCKANLTETEKSFVCPNNHNFDKAKQGYVNLLMSNKQGNHGDDKLMVKSRQFFLEKDHYAPMKIAVNEILGTGGTVLDAGCGEGYYSSLFAQNNTLYGIDISKEALKIAARKAPFAKFAVASIYELPFENESFDTCINIFAPDSPTEYLRILKPKGRLIMVTPMENHLMELKSAVYEQPYKNQYVDPARNGFAVKSSQEIKYTITLESTEEITSLFKMTPYYYNTSKSDIEKLDRLEFLTTRVEFLITEYEKL